MVSVPLFGGGTENRTVTFTHNRNRENIKPGETHGTLFGKIARYFEDLKLVAFTGSYDDLNGKPSSFPPSSHKHSKSDITDFPSSLPASDVKAWAKAANKPSYTWSEISSKPSAYPPASHTHSYLPLSGGTLAGKVYETQPQAVQHRGVFCWYGTKEAVHAGTEQFKPVWYECNRDSIQRGVQGMANTPVCPVYT